MRDFNEQNIEVSDSKIIGRLLTFIKPHKKRFIIAMILMLLSLGTELVIPSAMGYLLDILRKNEAPDVILKEVIFLTLLFAIFIAFTFVVVYLQSIFLQKIGLNIVVTLRDKVFQHIEKLAIGQINQIPVGKLVTRVTNDTNSISQMYTDVAINFIRNILYVIGIYIILWFSSPKMTLYLTITLPFVFLSSILFRNISRKSYRKVRSNVSEINAFLSENLSGMKVTQIFNQEEKVNRIFEERNRNLRKSHFREILVFGIYRPTIYMIAMAGAIIVLFTGIDEVIAGVLTAGSLYSYYLYTQNFFEPIQQMTEQFNTLQNALASSEKVFDVLDTVPEIVDSEDAIELESFSGRIEFKDVWFSYIPGEWVLKGVSFTVNPNETVAFVGATGSGKSTILSLVVRNYDIQKGQILIDGIDIKNIKISSLRKHIGQMMQDVFLFSGTIIDNITLKDDSITREEAIEAAKYVGADQFIESLPDSYDHVVLERGNNFSSGQRQLISFARALTYKPSLMILDEATANIDSETESIIQESLNRIMNIQTMIIVAHRLSTIQHADKIILMQQGEIKEMGTHQELLSKKSLYYYLYELQYEEKEKGEND